MRGPPGARPQRVRKPRGNCRRVSSSPPPRLTGVLRRGGCGVRPVLTGWISGRSRVPLDPARPPYDPCWHFRGHRHRRSNGATGRLGTSRWARGYWAVSIRCPVRFVGRRPGSDRQDASQRRRGRVRQSGMPDPWQASKPPRRLFSETSPTPRRVPGLVGSAYDRRLVRRGAGSVIRSPSP